MTSKEIDKILVEYLFGLTLSSGQALDPNDSVGSSVRAETVKDLLALIQQARVDQTRVIRDRFVRSGWEYKWLTEVISELKGETK